MTPLASPLIQWLLAYRYVIIFPLAVVEGPILMFVCGFLLHRGYFDLLPLYLTLVLGDFAADLGWYAVGYWGAKPFIQRFGRYFSLSLKSVEKIEQLFEKHHDKILFISKITMGFGFAIATLVAAGMAKVPFKKYALYNFLGGFIWTGLLLALGYFFGDLYSALSKGFRELSVFAAIVIVLALLIGFNKFMRKTMLNDNGNKSK